jgi:CRP-like cAMP-binding protein
MDIADQIKYLKRLSLLEGLPSDVVSKLADKLKLHRLSPGMVLFSQGAPGDSLYIIQTGQVKVVVNTADGKELVLNQFGPGEFFGEMSLIDQEPRSASAMAITPAVLFELKRDAFQQVLMGYPSALFEITRSLSTKLRFAATYIQKAIEWSQQVAAGDYQTTLGEIETLQPSVEADSPDAARVNALIGAFFWMVKDVKEREEELKRQVSELRIEIDEEKEARQVAEIVDSEYFHQLQEKINEIRQKSRKPTQPS